MKDLKSLPAEELVSKTRALVREELRIGLDVLDHLREIERRSLFVSRGHSSLFVFCMRELGYSEPQTQLRIDAMRAMRDTPAIEEKVRAGVLHVTTIAKVQKFFRKEKMRTGKPYAMAARAELFGKIEGKSSRAVELELLRLSPGSVVNVERERALSPELTEIKMVITTELREQLKSLQALYSHRMKDPQSMRELLGILASDALDQMKVTPKTRTARKPEQNIAPISPQVENDSPVLKAGIRPRRSRYIPAPIRREIWRRDRGACAYRDPKTGQTCGSRHFLQIDHIRPHAYGGSSLDPANLRLYCGTHNRHAWERAESARQFRSDSARASRCSRG